MNKPNYSKIHFPSKIDKKLYVIYLLNRNDKSYFSRLQGIYSGNSKFELYYNPNIHHRSSSCSIQLPKIENKARGTSAINRIMQNKDKESYDGRLKKIYNGKSIYHTNKGNEKNKEISMIKDSPSKTYRKNVDLYQRNIENLRLKKRIYNV